MYMHVCMCKTKTCEFNYANVLLFTHLKKQKTISAKMSDVKLMKYPMKYIQDDNSIVGERSANCGGNIVDG